MPALSLEGRLLCASGAAYAIKGSASLLADDPLNYYIAGAGFLRPPQILFGGVDNIDGCLVGETTDGFVVAFRGTLGFDLHSIPTLRDWLLDFQAQPIAVAGFPGFIHDGFAGALAVLMPQIVDELGKQQGDSSQRRQVYLTGHSKGGAVAALAAWGLRTAGFPLG